MVDTPNAMTVLAPMRGLSSRKFVDILQDCGEPDAYISEFLRVHQSSTVTREISELINTWNSDKPLSIQLLGRDPHHIMRVAKLLEKCNIDNINLNFGCPMPKIEKKGVGGALLKELHVIDEILTVLTNEICVPITVKARLGYYSSDEFHEFLHVLAKHKLSETYFHVRTVKGLYNEEVDYEHLKIAKSMLPCRVFANGDIKTAEHANVVLFSTGVDGVMIGRAAISNPWIFRQIREVITQRPPFLPSCDDYMRYIEKLIYQNTTTKNTTTIKPLQDNLGALKKYLVPISDFVDTVGDFSLGIRRSTSVAECLKLCEFFFKTRYDPINTFE